MKGKESSGDPEGREAKSGLASSGRGLDMPAEKGFFADAGRFPQGWGRVSLKSTSRGGLKGV